MEIFYVLVILYFTCDDLNALRTCSEIQKVAIASGESVKDGTYTLDLPGGRTLKTYCDMTRNGGGWTLVVASTHTDWTAENVWEKNIDKPSLHDDYSMLKHADLLIDQIRVATVQYRLESSPLGGLGGIFRARASYNFSSTNPSQTDVKVLTHFKRKGVFNLERRVPYVYAGSVLTTSRHPQNNQEASVTSNTRLDHPASFGIPSGSTQPQHIWYWLREDSDAVSASCQLYLSNGQTASGEYNILLNDGKVVPTYCDMDEREGGWTLIANIDPRESYSYLKILFSEPTPTKVLKNHFSLLSYLISKSFHGGSITDNELMIRTNGVGGIFKISKDFDLSACTDTMLKLRKKFGTWDHNAESITNYPLCLKNNLVGKLLYTEGASNDKGVFAESRACGGRTPFTYTQATPHPSFIHVYFRSGVQPITIVEYDTCEEYLRASNAAGTKLVDDDYYLYPGETFCPMTTLLEELGCYVQNNAIFQTSINQRNAIDWYDMSKTVRQCAEKVREAVSTANYFGVVFYGECWHSGENLDGNLVESDNCWQHVGKDNAMRLYKYIQQEEQSPGHT